MIGKRSCSVFFAAFILLLGFVPLSRSAAGTLTITTTSLPAAVQYQTYAPVTLAATGGTPPYTWSVTTAYATLPEGMNLNPNTGVISSSAVGGQGGYQFQVQVKDSTGSAADALLTINVTADNTLGGCSIFPADSIFHHRVDFATTNLPVDTSPAAPIPAVYQTGHIRPFFGSDAGPDGIPFIRVPYNQPPVDLQWVDYGGDSDPATDTPTDPTSTDYPNVVPQYPTPNNAPVEGTANSVLQGGDGHVLVLQTAGGGNDCQLYETWSSTFVNGSIPWTASNGTSGTYQWTAGNGAHWDLGSDALRTLGLTSADAAGLPIMPLTVNYDETCPGGQATATSPCTGIVGHPIRFTLNHMLQAMVWPGRHIAGVGDCTFSDGSTTYSRNNFLLSQSSPPASCTFSGPSAEIYRLQPSVTYNGQSNTDPRTICPASTNPQANAIITAMEDYGIILADNGQSGGLIGTPDARWNNNDLSCLNNISLAYFEPVNVSSLEINPDSGQTAGTVYGEVLPGDTSVTLQDAVAVARYVIGLSVPGINLAAAAVDGTGSITLNDAVLIAQYVVGLISKFPVQG